MKDVGMLSDEQCNAIAEEMRSVIKLAPFRTKKEGEKMFGTLKLKLMGSIQFTDFERDAARKAILSIENCLAVKGEKGKRYREFAMADACKFASVGNFQRNLAEIANRPKAKPID